MSDAQFKALFFLTVTAILANLGILDTWVGILLFSLGFWGWELIKDRL